MEDFFMKIYKIGQVLKTGISVVIVLLLLPYLATVFINGDKIKRIEKDEFQFVKVSSSSGVETKVEEIPWDTYFIGILAKQIPQTYEKEAIKAQAVILRTKLYKELDRKEHTVFQESFFSLEELEKKWGLEHYEEYYKKYFDAMKETENKVLMYEEDYAEVPFHQSSAGKTRNGKEVLENGTYDYLTSVECKEDKKDKDWEQVSDLEYQTVQEKCRDFIAAVDQKKVKEKLKFEDIQILEYDSAGYVKTMKIKETICSGEQFRKALSLPSGCMSLEDYKGKLRIHTKGNGHGLGMSQFTANQMAKAGEGYEDILQYFFVGATLSNGEEINFKLE